MTNEYFLGVDTGGTFTDFVLWHRGAIKIHKVLSTPAAPEQAILQGISDLQLDQLPQNTYLYIVHGSTVATNAILERKGVSCVFITNHGFADMLTIGRQTRRELYNLQPAPPLIPVPSSHCLETGGRLDARGNTITSLTQADITHLMEQVRQLQPRAVAINLLFSYLDDRYEKQIEAALPADLFVSRSSFILPEYREYERGMTTWLNAYIGPLIKDYLQRLATCTAQARISVMQSSGGTIDIAQAGDQAVHMVLSGPAGGLAAARYLGEVTNTPRLLTFDMGGTSTDVALVEDKLQLTNEGSIGDFPVAIPMVDMHTIGAGGGSIAYVDAGGLLQVGPQSAGADPGPACYGKGGTHATVTDANLVLGRIRADDFLGGAMQLDAQAAHNVVSALAVQLGLSVEACARGIIAIANDHMVQALRVMSVQRGIDPRELTLMSFGGAGGLHVCALADALDMQRAIVPVYSGVLSALGMLVAPRSRQLSQTVGKLLDDCDQQMILDYYAPLVASGTSALLAEGVMLQAITVEYSIDLRYAGQSYFLNVPWISIDASRAAFHQLHAQRYGHELDMPVELVNVRIGVYCAGQALQLNAMDIHTNTTPRSLRLPGVEQEVLLYLRASLAKGMKLMGPALITESVATTYLASGWSAGVDTAGNLILQKDSGGAQSVQ
jgi:N-methylhydantoinase A